jgi:catechol 2,3-dioxygenase-like lactoylglutathione lyase family enzyme
MRPRIKVLTLAVRDLEESLAFYRDGMGLPTQGIIGTEFEDGAVVFFNMNDDLHGYWHCTRGPRWPRTQGSQLDHRAQQNPLSATSSNPNKKSMPS